MPVIRSPYPDDTYEVKEAITASGLEVTYHHYANGTVEPDLLWDERRLRWVPIHSRALRERLAREIEEQHRKEETL